MHLTTKARHVQPLGNTMQNPPTGIIDLNIKTVALPFHAYNLTKFEIKHWERLKRRGRWQEQWSYFY
jgi:hypothetical protein